MKLLSITMDSASVQFSIDELDAMRNALNEARLLLKGRDGADFETRVGLSVDDAGVLMKELQALITCIDDKSEHRYSERASEHQEIQTSR